MRNYDLCISPSKYSFLKVLTMKDIILIDCFTSLLYFQDENKYSGKYLIIGNVASVALWSF